MNNSVWDLLNEKAVSDKDLNILMSDSLEEIKYLERNNFGAIKVFHKFNYKYGHHKLSDLLNTAMRLSSIPAESFLYFSEVYLTYFNFVHAEGKTHISSDIINSIDAITHYIDKLNHKFEISSNKKVIITKKDTVSEVVASHFISLNDSEFAWRVISYNSVSITISDKVDFLREMYVKIESILKHNPEYKDNKTFKINKRLLNYLRHYQTSHKKVNEIDKNLEYYCDFAYNLSLQCLLMHHNDLEYQKNITTLNKINNSSENK